MRKKGIYRLCFCGNEYYEFPYQLNQRKFCSPNCANKANSSRNSLSKIGEKNPMFGKKAWNAGKKLTDEEKRKWQESVEGTNWGKFGFGYFNKTKSQFKSREKHPYWLGEYNQQKYAENFRDSLKKYIKRRDNHKCYFDNPDCSYKLAIHHIDYDKNNTDECNLITLCNRHHGITNFHRIKWKKYFIKIIKKKYANRTKERE